MSVDHSNPPGAVLFLVQITRAARGLEEDSVRPVSTISLIFCSATACLGLFFAQSSLLQSAGFKVHTVNVLVELLLLEPLDKGYVKMKTCNDMPRLSPSFLWSLYPPVPQHLAIYTQYIMLQNYSYCSRCLP